MGITVNKGNGGGYSLFTGVVNMAVIAVNPTLEELKSLGYHYQKEPVYELTDDGNLIVGHKVDFYLEAKTKDGKQIQAVHTIFVKDTTIESIMIDEFGRFSTDESKLEGESHWHPKQGEIDLVGFLEALCNVHKNDQNYIEDIDLIINEGDVKELQGYIDEAEGNLVKVLLGVRKGKYQTVFSKQINRSWTEKLDYLWKRFVDNEKYMKDDYYGDIDMTTFNAADFNFKEYIIEEEEEDSPKVSKMENKPSKSDSPEQISSMTGRPQSTKSIVDNEADSIADSLMDNGPDDVPF